MKLKKKETWNLRGNAIEIAPPNKGLSDKKSADIFTVNPFYWMEIKNWTGEEQILTEQRSGDDEREWENFVEGAVGGCLGEERLNYAISALDLS